MNSIKSLFGVMMLGLAIWLLSRILPGQITLCLWACLLIISAVAFGALDLQAKLALAKEANKFADGFRKISLMDH